MKRLKCTEIVKRCGHISIGTTYSELHRNIMRHIVKMHRDVISKASPNRKKEIDNHIKSRINNLKNKKYAPKIIFSDKYVYE